MENAGVLTLTRGGSESVTNGKRRGPKGTSDLDQGSRRKRDKLETPGPQGGHFCRVCNDIGAPVSKWAYERAWEIWQQVAHARAGRT